MNNTLARIKIRLLIYWKTAEIKWHEAVLRFKSWQLNRLNRKVEVLQSKAFVQEDDDE